MNKKKILFLSRGFVYNFENNIHAAKYDLFKKDFCGDIVQVVNNKNYKLVNNGSFNYVGCYISPFLLHKTFILNIYFFFWSLYLIGSKKKDERYDVIIACDALVAAPIAAIASKIFRVPLITEFNGNYISEHVWNNNSFATSIKKRLVKLIIPFVAKFSSSVRLLYPTQLDGYNFNIDTIKKYLIHEFVPIEGFKYGESILHDSKYILFLGGPFLLKGVDLLVASYKNICKKHPNIELKIYGWSEGDEQVQLEAMAQECENINFYRPVNYNEAIDLIRKCEFLVLPSRTEAMGRVLLESMAFGKPVIGANVDGIPTYLDDGEVGLLFESENSNELTEKLEMLLSDKALFERLGKNARESVMNKYTETIYFHKYKKMINETIEIFQKS